MKKVVLKLDLHDNHAKRKVMKAVSTLPRIDSLAVDMKDGKLTVIGDVDPVDVVGKLRKKQMHAEILTVGPAKEEKPKDGGGDPNKGKADPKKDPIAQILEAYNNSYYHPYLNNYYLHHHVSADEDPNSCVIC